VADGECEDPGFGLAAFSGAAGRAWAWPLVIHCELFDQSGGGAPMLRTRSIQAFHEELGAAGLGATLWWCIRGRAGIVDEQRLRRLSRA